LLCIHSDRGSSERTERASLFSLRPRDVAVLLVAGFVSTFGYRQYLLGWQLKGLWDFLKGRKDWDKFARKGFAVRAT
jgi:hypothetical protein